MLKLRIKAECPPPREGYKTYAVVRASLVGANDIDVRAFEAPGEAALTFSAFGRGEVSIRAGLVHSRARTPAKAAKEMLFGGHQEAGAWLASCKAKDGEVVLGGASASQAADGRSIEIMPAEAAPDADSEGAEPEQAEPAPEVAPRRPFGGKRSGRRKGRGAAEGEGR